MTEQIPMHRLAVSVGRTIDRAKAWGPRFAKESLEKFVAWRNRPKVHKCRLCMEPLDDPNQLECEGEAEAAACWAQTSW